MNTIPSAREQKAHLINVIHSKTIAGKITWTRVPEQSRATWRAETTDCNFTLYDSGMDYEGALAIVLKDQMSYEVIDAGDITDVYAVNPIKALLGLLQLKDPTKGGYNYTYAELAKSLQDDDE